MKTVLARNPAVWKLEWNAHLLAPFESVMISALVGYLQTRSVFSANLSPLLAAVVGVLSANAFAERLHLGS
ncbi:hypothetical protein SADUNF_Sadunf11G0110200 [Salix dunnii]|uniref:Uncharacterized protein n=1 Tax=Salix dunnii TaxID=1413687 RepID=A0A835JPV5_9ROSI|nr:hypothetical protein SADUNF_Sadunf11G0110200 [Salix dunnii]